MSEEQRVIAELLLKRLAASEAEVEHYRQILRQADEEEPHPKIKEGKG